MEENKIAHHSFYPFIHYKYKQRKYTKNTDLQVREIKKQRTINSFMKQMNLSNLLLLILTINQTWSPCNKIKLNFTFIITNVFTSIRKIN